MELIIRGLFYRVVSVKAAMWKISGDVVVIKNGRSLGAQACPEVRREL